MAWIYVLFAANVEVFWVIGLKHSSNALEWIGTGIAIVISFYFIITRRENSILREAGWSLLALG